MTLVKICGLMEPEHAVAAVEAGADFLGLVFAPSRRQVTPERAARIVAAARASGTATIIGVFVNAAADEINRVVMACDLDWVQLSGNEDEEAVASVSAPVMKTVHVGPGFTTAHLERRAARAEYLHLDTLRPGPGGGTGETFDWGMLPPIERPFFLAGGLHPGNVAEAIRRVRPAGVDVSSGVETGGMKDPGKIRSFVAAVRVADAAGWRAPGSKAVK